MVFSQECLERIWCVSSVYWSVTEVAWKAWRLCEVSTEVLSCNREVTWIFGKRPCLYQSDGSPSVVTSLAWACCEVLRGIIAFVWNKYSGCVFRHPCVLFRHKLPPLKTFEPVTDWDLVIFDWFVLSMRMQVILDSSFARPGLAPIWGGKKGEFRDWTNQR